MHKLGRYAVVLAASLFSASLAHADSVTATLNNCGPQDIVDIHYQGQDLGECYAGSINWTVDSSSGSTAPTGSFGTYCDDLTQDIYIGGTYSYNIVAMTTSPDPAPPTNPGALIGMSAAVGQDIENLYALEYDGIGSDNDKAAAFQIAIWEMEYETDAGYDVTSGNFYVTGESTNVATLADSYVAAATTAGSLTYHNQILALTNPTAQDQLFVGGPTLEPGPLPSVPAPAAALGGIPLLGALAVIRKIRQRGMR